MDHPQNSLPQHDLDSRVDVDQTTSLQTAYSNILQSSFLTKQSAYDSHLPPQTSQSLALTTEYSSLLHQIEQSYIVLPRHLKIRTESWVTKMSAPMPTITWRKNRNLHAFYLLHSITKRDFREPFHQAAPDGPLRTMSGDVKARAKRSCAVVKGGFWRGIHGKVRKYEEWNEEHDETANDETANDETANDETANEETVNEETAHDGIHDGTHDNKAHEDEHQNMTLQMNSHAVGLGLQDDAHSEHGALSEHGAHSEQLVDDSSNVSVAISGIQSFADPAPPHTFIVGEIPTQTSRPPSQSSMGSSTQPYHDINTQTSVSLRRRGSRDNGRASKSPSLSDINVSFDSVSFDRRGSGFTPLPTIVHSPTPVRRGSMGAGGGGGAPDRTPPPLPSNIPPPLPSNIPPPPPQMAPPRQIHGEFNTPAAPPHYHQTPIPPPTSTPFVYQPRHDPQQPAYGYQNQEPTPAQTAMYGDYLSPEVTALQMMVQEQSERMRLMQEQLNAQQLGHTLELQRLESMHIVEMEQLRKVHGQHMDRFRIQNANGSSTHNPLEVSSRAPVVTGMPGHTKAWNASQLPLEQYLKYLDKFQEDATVLSTLAKNQETPLRMGDGESSGLIA